MGHCLTDESQIPPKCFFLKKGTIFEFKHLDDCTHFGELGTFEDGPLFGGQVQKIQRESYFSYIRRLLKIGRGDHKLPKKKQERNHLHLTRV